VNSRASHDALSFCNSLKQKVLLQILQSRLQTPNSKLTFGTPRANRTAASLMKTSRPRRHHFSERGLPLCLITFRAFLQLSFQYRAWLNKPGFPSFKLHLFSHLQVFLTFRSI
ncbi:MAG: hypothetical protein ACRD43_11380, partial [Pyrinomonadaceae bacterium]